MDDTKEARKIVTVEVGNLVGQVTLQMIQDKIQEAKDSYKYDWIKFYIGGNSFFDVFSTAVILYATHYQTDEEHEKDKRRELYEKLKKEFEPKES